MLLFSISCSKDNDSSKSIANSSNSLKISVSATPPASNDFYIYYYSGSIEVKLFDGSGNQKAVQYISGTSGTLDFGNVNTGSYTVEARLNVRKITKSNGVDTANGYAYKKVDFTTDGTAKIVNMTLEF
ncbi:MAG: hypothetical protein NTU43_08480 [Bacteroidetes bacterium]|nr:hypothetical protein [Bacteroidota bacterium]